MPNTQATTPLAGRDAAVLLVKLRRLVSRELDISLDLGDDDALRELHRQARRCQGEAVAQLLSQLEGHLPKLPDNGATSAKPTPARAMYRGAVLPTQPATVPDSPAEPPPPPREGGHYVTYRGQRYWRED